jgi:hypothetical protein
MSLYRRNRLRIETINRYGMTAGLPLFEGVSKRIPEPTRSRFRAAKKSMPIATDTRNLAYTILTHDQVKLTEIQLTVLDAIRQIGPATNEEIAHHLGWPINRVVGRTFELREYTVVVDAGRRKCKITGNICHIWRMK